MTSDAGGNGTRNSDESSMLVSSVDNLRSYAVCELDAGGRFTRCNNGVETVLGYAGHELLGRNFSLLYSQADMQRGQPHCLLSQAAASGVREWDGALVRKDGARFRASLVIEQVADIGEELLFVLIVRDVTAHYEAQKKLRDAEDMATRSQRLDSVSKLTLGLAHDFNNLLTVIVNSLDMLAARRSGDESTRRILDIAHSAVDRGSMLTRQMLAFGRGQTLVPEPHEISQLVGKSLELFQRVCGEGIELKARLAHDMPVVMVDPVQLEAAIFNLLGNARDAMAGSGKIVLATQLCRLPAAAHPNGPDVDYVSVSVGDSGPGIGQDLHETVFEPFFTTKGVGEGSGLGLSQVYGFAAQSGGMAQIGTSELGGAAVSIYLPVQAGPVP